MRKKVKRKGGKKTKVKKPMLAGLSKSLHNMAKGWFLLALFIVFVGFIIMTLPRLQAAPGGDIESLDAQFYYTPDTAFETISRYGRSAPFWIRMYVSWDIVIPLLYSLIFSLSISWLFQRCCKSGSPLLRLNLVPLGAGLLDILENGCIVILLCVYPAEPVGVAWLSTLFTMGKMGLLCLSVVLTVMGLVMAAFNVFRKQ